jgi:hypothetical protein
MSDSDDDSFDQILDDSDAEDTIAPSTTAHISESSKADYVTVKNDDNEENEVEDEDEFYSEDEDEDTEKKFDTPVDEAAHYRKRYKVCNVERKLTRIVRTR